MENTFLCGIGRSFGGYGFLHIMRGLEASHDPIPYLAELSRDQIEEGLWVNLSPSFYNLSLKEKRCGFSRPVVVSVFPIVPFLKSGRNLVCVIHCLIVLKWVFPRATRRITPFTIHIFWF